MAHSALTPVFRGLSAGLHALFALLAAVVLTRAVLAPTGSSVAVVVLTLVLIGTYCLGVAVPRPARAQRDLRAAVWLGVLSLLWAVLLSLTPDASYLVFPLFFLHLHLLGRRWGTVAIVVSTLVVVGGLGVHSGWTMGGVIGPFVGAGVALLIGLGYQALAREAEQREALVQELLETRGQLAATEHEAGVLAERGRLAREIHDTVAQGLSSIQMLLHAAERLGPDRPGIEHVRLARETAAASLADTRRFIRELTPPDLDDDRLGGALRRLAATRWASRGLEVRVRVSDTVLLPMHLQTALLRIAQGAMANVLQHANATRATITLAVEDRDLRFTIADDGEGFDPGTLPEDAAHTDSFGLRATRERVQQLGGALTLDAAPGQGTRLTVELSLPAAA